MTQPNPSALRHFSADFLAGIVVFLVAIPLCLGVALASGAPLFSGMIAGILGGIVVGTISGSRLSVSGPAAGMAAIVLTAITQLGSFEVFLLALIVAGILQIIIGALRAGFIADYIPSNVIQGLLCAIGILIIIKQLPFAFSYTSENALLLEEMREVAGNVDKAAFEIIAYHANVGAMLITFISLAILIFFDKTKNAILKTIPGSIVVVIAGVIINEIFIQCWPALIQSNDELVNIPVSNNMQSFFALFDHPNWSEWKNPAVYFYGVVLAAIASLEALLNLEAIEKLDTKRRYVSRNRELVAQGVGNTLAGLLGGIPITSVVVRSSVNIQAGAATKLSTIWHGILIFSVALFIPHWMNAIPLAALAAILIHVGFKLTKPYIYQQLYAQGWARFIPFIITILAIIFTNLLTGILIGLFFSFFFILRDNSKIQLDIINEKHPAGIIKRIVLPQQLSFLSKASLVSELDSIPAQSNLIIDARHTKYIDQDIIEVLDVYKKSQAPNKHISVNYLGFKEHYEIHNHMDFINVTTYDLQSSLTPDDVLALLQEGNKRFVNDQRIHRSVLDDIKANATSQHPLAIILGCIDSRVPVETVFDMGLGNVFVSRVAGNVVNDDILASMEFACHVAGAKLILVLGHTYCGAIKAACDNGAGGHLDHLLAKIKPAIDAESTTKTDRTGSNADFVTNVTRINVEHVLHTIRSRSEILNRLLENKQIALCGAMYDVKTGVVSFL